jgi:hypothetical protein
MALHGVLNDEYFPARLAAGEALWRIDGQAKVAVPLLVEALDKHKYLAQRSASVLGQIGPQAKEAIPALLAIMHDRKHKPAVQAEAARALKKIDSTAVK